MTATKRTISINQAATIIEDVRQGFKTKWLVDEHGCPACGAITKFEYKPPTMPAVRVCKHCTGPSNKEIGSSSSWTINYTYPTNPKMPIRRGKGSSMVGYKPHQSIYSIFMERVKDQEQWTMELNFEKGESFTQIGEKIHLGNFVGFDEGMAQLIRTAIPIIKEKKLPEPSPNNTYINQHAWHDYAIMDWLVLAHLKRAFQIIAGKRKEPSHYQIINGKIENVKYKNINGTIEEVPIQTDLFSFFPQEAPA